METKNTENEFKPVGQTVEEIDKNNGLKNDNTNNSNVTKTENNANPVQEIESLCTNCEKNGTTKLLLTDIPYFREIIIMSFYCPHCGFKNSEVQSAGKIQPKGSIYRLKVEKPEDLNRQIVKSEHATVSIEEIQLEIPAQHGKFTNVEGLLTEVAEDLNVAQPERFETSPELAVKIEIFINTLKKMAKGEQLPFTVKLDDPSGNSWIEFIPGEAQHKWSKTEYIRNKDQNFKLGLTNPDEEKSNDDEEESKDIVDNTEGTDINKETNDEEETNLKDEVQVFKATCPSCLRKCETNMKMVDIPNFKQVVLMSTVCDHCGYKSNEVKTGGEIPDKGKIITLKLTDPEDLSRDLLKSETCELKIPELDLDLTPGTLGGRFTTVEGILREVLEELNGKVYSEQSDSMDDANKEKWRKFISSLQEAIDGKVNFTMILKDPLAASYIQNVYAPDEDPNMTIEDFTRSKEEDEDLGLNDMVV